MKLSARNDLKGKITAISKGTVMAKITIDIGGQTIVSLIGIDSAEDLNLAIGDDVHAIIKSTEVIIGK
jgi:molybdate transport system regulatory protein